MIRIKAMEARLKQAASVRTRTVGTRVVLLDERTGRCYELNRLGGEVWARLDGTATLDQIAIVLAPSFGLAPPALAADVATFARHLQDSGLVDLVSGTVAGR